MPKIDVEEVLVRQTTKLKVTGDCAALLIISFFFHFIINNLFMREEIFSVNNWINSIFDDSS